MQCINHKEILKHLIYFPELSKKFWALIKSSIKKTVDIDDFTLSFKFYKNFLKTIFYSNSLHTNLHDMTIKGPYGSQAARPWVGGYVLVIFWGHVRVPKFSAPHDRLSGVDPDDERNCGKKGGGRPSLRSVSRGPQSF